MTERAFRLFVSSTFADFTAEREALWSSVFPQLERLCAELGARFEPVDMRWGVSAEQVDAQDTMPICLRELRRCLDTGLSPSLLILIGDRYGSRLLPEEIEMSQFEQIFARVAARYGTPSAKALHDYYAIDENAIDPVHRLDFEQAAALTPRKRQALIRQLQTLLDVGAESLPSDQRDRLTASATEREIAAGLRDGAHQNGHALCCIRTLAGGRDMLAPWTNAGEDSEQDASNARRLRRLKRRIRNQLGPRVIGFRTRLIDGAVDPGYIERFCRMIRKRLSDDIRTQAAGWRKETT